MSDRNDRFFRHLNTAPMDDLRSDVWFWSMRIALIPREELNEATGTKAWLQRLSDAHDQGRSQDVQKEMHVPVAVKALCRIRPIVDLMLEDKVRRARVSAFIDLVREAPK